MCEREADRWRGEHVRQQERRKTSEEIGGCSEGDMQRVGVAEEDAGIGGR